ncbi:hypothetical protein HPB47_004343 [Ixodes persulcatus]|uniref:Uncharacterized protein n=1 Tax=Ixodes persulcatus TaxID=34615 RepID=A0AC60PFY8_IXOPE|nr:hypothetical protein HPB47_004343 [Ixodes persulcatus]
MSDDTEPLDQTQLKRGEGKRGTLSTSEIQANIHSALIDSYDTSPAVMACLAFLLAKHPDVQERFRSEVASSMNSDGSMDTESILRSRYVDQVVLETVRLYPPLVRFNDDNGRNFNPMAYQGFGNGPRSCIGMRYAQQLLKLTFANILAKYKIIPDERYFETAEARTAAAAAECAAAAAPARQLCSRLGGSEARALAYGFPCGGFKFRPRLPTNHANCYTEQTLERASSPAVFPVMPGREPGITGKTAPICGPDGARPRAGVLRLLL